jgi:hypothetical protein
LLTAVLFLWRHAKKTYCLLRSCSARGNGISVAQVDANGTKRWAGERVGQGGLELQGPYFREGPSFRFFIQCFCCKKACTWCVLCVLVKHLQREERPGTSAAPGLSEVLAGPDNTRAFRELKRAYLAGTAHKLRNTIVKISWPTGCCCWNGGVRSRVHNCSLTDGAHQSRARYHDSNNNSDTRAPVKTDIVYWIIFGQRYGARQRNNNNNDNNTMAIV